ncbi:MAG TPA: hypothetical protein VGS97_17045 [Actinocrinis sp.]|uniref:hypothetical protein n=1 Tax=Actinocrinis sp. TaxID=1920516 RepID=UPI002DDDB9F1|nr:hypothetical protein [Actinocrinis sp.]HEV2345809.1 hypothetical protein [Actinocrinis sp.]
MYARRGGELVVFDGQRPLSEWLLRSGTRYEVDLGYRFHEFNARLPARGDAYQFDAAISLTYRVTDPKKIVRHHIADGVPLVVDHVLSTIRSVIRRFSIEEVGTAEETINDRFRAPIDLPEGITIVRCDIRLTPDEAARNFFQEKLKRERYFEYHQRLAEHERGDGYTNLLAMMVALDPEHAARTIEVTRTAAAIERDRQAEHNRTSLDLLRLMIEKELLQTSDLETIRGQLIEGIQSATAGTAMHRFEVLAHEPHLLSIESVVAPEIDSQASVEIVVRSGDQLERGTAYQIGPQLFVMAANLVARISPADGLTAQPTGAPEPTTARILFVSHAIGIAIVETGEPAQRDRGDHVLDVLLGLALAYGRRYAATGADGDLSATIELYQQAVSNMPTGDARRPSALSNLAAALRNRYERTADTNDLDTAIELLREALVATSADQPERPAMLSNLAAALRARATQKDSPPDLDESIVLLREALAATIPDQPERPVMLSNLATALQTRYEHSGDATNLDESVALLREALRYTPERHTRHDRIEILLRRAVDLQSSREAR